MIEGIETIQYDRKRAFDKLPKPYNKPDIVVFHELYRFEYISIYRELVKLGIPYVIIPHGCLSKQAQQKKRIKKTIANIVFFNKFLKSARLVQYLANNEQIMSACPKYPSAVMGNGVSVPSEKKSSFSRLNIRFVYIGRLEMHIKGLDLLLAAIKNSEDSLRKCCATFEIYGPDYDDSHELLAQMIQKLNIGDLVRLEKEKMGIEKQEILLSASCFIQTSRTEGLPLGPLEALSYGLPCIVTHGVGLGGIIESYGAGYQSENTVEGVSKSIELFIQNIDKLENMSKSAIRLIEENYDIDVIARESVDRYYSMLN
jgi:glycosyltransferase involved in cell wall biosynthesis